MLLSRNKNTLIIQAHCFMKFGDLALVFYHNLDRAVDAVRLVYDARKISPQQLFFLQLVEGAPAVCEPVLRPLTSLNPLSAKLF